MKQPHHKDLIEEPFKAFMPELEKLAGVVRFDPSV